MPELTLFDPAPIVKAELRVIPGWPENFASSDGIIYSKRRGVLSPLKPVEAGGADADYLYVTLCHDGKQRRIGVHQAVALAFLPPPEMVDGKLQNVVRHRDNNTRNNMPSNLLWGTQKQNLADRAEHGTLTRGEQNGCAKITVDAVAEIRRRRAAGETCRQIGADFGLSYQTVHKIARGLRWSHVAAPVAPRERAKRKDSKC